MAASKLTSSVPQVLVVEDTLMVAETLVDQLEEFGCQVIGPASHLTRGLDLARRERLDGALLDVNLAGERCFPIAAILAERAIPFAFLTGYGDTAIAPEFREVPRLSKPFMIADLTHLLIAHFGFSLQQLALPG